jgi:hypothetical protein
MLTFDKDTAMSLQVEWNQELASFRIDVQGDGDLAKTIPECCITAHCRVPGTNCTSLSSEQGSADGLSCLPIADLSQVLPFV